MNWLHTWSGLVLGGLLYFIFITGAIGYFTMETDRWMRPEIVIVDKTIDQVQLLAVAEKRLTQKAPDASSWSVSFPGGRKHSLIIEWKNPLDEETGQGGERQTEYLDPQTGQAITVRDTGGGRLLYRMHYRLHYMPVVLAYVITSLAAMFMLIALITGIVIHKKIFIDFFTFRPGKKQLSWLDMHNVLSVLPLPFHLMITYSGLLFLMFTTMPSVIVASYGFDEGTRDRFFAEAFPSFVEESSVNNAAAENVSLSSILQQLEPRWGKNQLRWVDIENRGQKNAKIEVARQGYTGLSRGERLVYSGLSGELQHDSSSVQHSGAQKFRTVMVNLHEGLFSGIGLRWIYFLSSLMGAGMIATGMILWAGKRRLQASKLGVSKGLLLVEYLNVGTLVGLPIAIAAYFWANRLIPIAVEGRANWEINILFITWAIMLLYPVLLAKKRPLYQAWIDQLRLAAVAFCCLPLLNFFTTNKHLGVSLVQQDWSMAGFDLSMLGFGLCFYFAAHKVRNKHLLVATENSITSAKQTRLKAKPDPLGIQ